MANVRYVCLSDLHLGEEDSLLTAITPKGEVDLGSPSPVLLRLAECLAELLKHNQPSALKPVLILNGDLLELALAHDHEAAQAFTFFLAALMPANSELFGEIICIAGNHDHHLWETARETQYVNYIRRHAHDATLEPPWHTTKVFIDTHGKDRLESGFLTAVAHRLPNLARQNFEILMAYPNYGIAGDGRSVIFHHGHFIEPLYHLMSTIDTLIASGQGLPASLDELECENFAWIDFFWSAMGRSGDTGKDLERIYKATGDRRSLQAISDTLAHNVAQEYDLPYLWPDFVEEFALKHLLRAFVVNRLSASQERQQVNEQAEGLPLSRSAFEGLRWYVESLLPNHVLEKEQRPIPQPATFVFGHTHKPFERAMDFKGYAGPVQVLNTGGWIVDSVRPEPSRGAAIVLLDDGLNAVNLRMYDEGLYETRVADAAGAGSNPLREHIRRVLDHDPRPWCAFAGTARAEVGKRPALSKAAYQ